MVTGKSAKFNVNFLKAGYKIACYYKMPFLLKIKKKQTIFIHVCKQKEMEGYITRNQFSLSDGIMGLEIIFLLIGIL